MTLFYFGYGEDDMIVFHKPYFPEKSKALTLSSLYRAKNWQAQDVFKQTEYQSLSKRMYLTHSASGALEMMTILLKLKPGDEIVMPSYTYVATANAFERCGAKIVFADIEEDTLNIDPDHVSKLVNAKTRAIIPIHYGGIAANLDGLMRNTGDYCHLVEDAAHTIGAKYKGMLLGSIGTFGCISFHDTKNIHAGGSGGTLIVNQSQYLKTAQEILNQGTNQRAFLDHLTKTYEWQCIGGAFEMSPHSKMFLKGSLQNLDYVTTTRRSLWYRYQSAFIDLELKGLIQLAKVPNDAEINGHIFYILLNSEQIRDDLRNYLWQNGVDARPHYVSLHRSPYFLRRNQTKVLPNTDRISKQMLRLPIYAELTLEDQDRIIHLIWTYFKKKTIENEKNRV